MSAEHYNNVLSSHTMQKAERQAGRPLYMNLVALLTGGVAYLCVWQKERKKNKNNNISYAHTIVMCL